jgi:uncharacterized circularly permuted ATP-grasp superfamily protein
LNIAGYEPESGCFDEAFDADGLPRPHYEPLLEALEQGDLKGLRRRVEASVLSRELTFGEDEPIAVDPVPRLLTGEEWERLQAGVLQRTRALNAFLLDAYGPQRIFDAGVVPRRLLETSEGYAPAMQGLLDPAVPPATVAGLDLVRGPDGELRVLEDNLRMPSGAAYALAVREVVAAETEAPLRPRRQGDFLEWLGAALRAAAPEGRDDPVVAILSDGRQNGAWYEHERFGRELGLPIVTPEQLELSRERIFARLSRERRVQIDVIYRRQDGDRLTREDGGLTELGALLLPALRSGRLRCANALGTGLADDKLSHAYVERMVDFYLGEEPLLRSVPGYDLSDEADRREAMGRLDELVIKPRGGFGGHGVTIMPRASERFIAQEPVEISSHPTVRGSGLRPRRIDLRPFVVSGPDGAAAMVGGLTRFAQGAGEMVVNSSQGGGCKDTWVLENERR